MRNTKPVDNDGRARRRQPHGFAVRLRLWALWVLTGILLINTGFRDNYWDDWVEIEGETILPSGESRALLFHSTMTNDRGVREWHVGFRVDQVRADAATGVARVTVTGSDGLVQGGASVCEVRNWGEPDNGSDTGWIVDFEDCDLDLKCSVATPSCEATVEFTITSNSSDTVTVGWSAHALVDGTISCFRNPDKAGAAVSIELVP